MSNDTKWHGFRLNEAQVKREIRRATRRDGRRRVRRGLLVLCCAAIGFGMLVRWALLGAVRLTGEGMWPALRGGDVVLYVHSLPIPGAATLSPRRGELALVSSYDGAVRHRVVRRVIALAGDEVFVDGEGRVTVNGEELDEPYATWRVAGDSESTGSGLIPNPFALEDESAAEPEAEEPREDGERWAEVTFPVTVPEGRLFVLADDRNAFADSRSSAFGMVSEAEVIGLPCAVLWPVDRIRLVEDFRGMEHLGELNPLPKPAPTPEPVEDGQNAVLQ